jgi:hypothetical protein
MSGRLVYSYALLNLCCVLLNRLQVTLWNTGEDAYQHRVYGDYLTVERVIKVGAASSALRVACTHCLLVAVPRLSLHLTLVASCNASAKCLRSCYEPYVQRSRLTLPFAWLLRFFSKNLLWPPDQRQQQVAAAGPRWPQGVRAQEGPG